MELAWSAVLVCLERRGVWDMELPVLKPRQTLTIAHPSGAESNFLFLVLLLSDCM